MVPMDISKWYAVTVGDDSVNQVAQRSNVAQTTLNAQVRTGKLKPEVVVAIATAYGTDALDALVIAGLITREHIRAHGVRGALAAATDEEIADEVYARLTRGGEHEAFDTAPSRSHLRAVSAAGETLAARDADDDAEAEAQTEDA